MGLGGVGVKKVVGGVAGANETRRAASDNGKDAVGGQKLQSVVAWDEARAWPRWLN